MREEIKDKLMKITWLKGELKKLEESLTYWYDVKDEWVNTLPCLERDQGIERANTCIHDIAKEIVYVRNRITSLESNSSK